MLVRYGRKLASHIISGCGSGTLIHTSHWISWYFLRAAGLPEALASPLEQVKAPNSGSQSVAKLKAPDLGSSPSPEVFVPYPEWSLPIYGQTQLAEKYDSKRQQWQYWVPPAGTIHRHTLHASAGCRWQCSSPASGRWCTPSRPQPCAAAAPPGGSRAPHARAAAWHKRRRPSGSGKAGRSARGGPTGWLHCLGAATLINTGNTSYKRYLSINVYPDPPTPALAKAGAAPGTTAGVELLLLRFPRSNLSCSHQATSIASAVCQP